MWRCTLKALAPSVFGLAEGRVGIAVDRGERHCQIRAGVLKDQCFIPPRDMPVRDDRQLLDVKLDRLDTILGNGCRVGQHDRDRLADIAHPVQGDDRLAERLGSGRCLQPQRDFRHHADPDLGCSDHRMHAGERQSRLCIDCANAAMCQWAAQDSGMQHPVSRKVGNVFAAPAQKTQILDTLNRGADVAVYGRYGHGVLPLR